MKLSQPSVRSSFDLCFGLSAGAVKLLASSIKSFADIGWMEAERLANLSAVFLSVVVEKFDDPRGGNAVGATRLVAKIHFIPPSVRHR